MERWSVDARASVRSAAGRDCLLPSARSDRARRARDHSASGCVTPLLAIALASLVALVRDADLGITTTSSLQFP